MAVHAVGVGAGRRLLVEVRGSRREGERLELEGHMSSWVGCAVKWLGPAHGTAAVPCHDGIQIRTVQWVRLCRLTGRVLAD